MYHRIADLPIDFWRLAVAPANFEEQLRVLRRTRYPLPLGKFVSKLVAGTLPPNAVALTFDDGYVDNLAVGKPRLEAADVPATVLLATGFVDSPEPFWWDELAQLILLEDVPRSFEFVVRGETVIFNFWAESPNRDHRDAPLAPSKEREAALWSLWQTLRHLDERERGAVMVKLRSIFTSHDFRASLGRAMTGKEVQTLMTDGLVTIGAHTVTHPSLPGLSAAACYREIAESKIACEALVKSPVTAFSYPYGDFDTEVCKAVKTGGFSFACSVQGDRVTRTCDVFALPRVHVHNMDGDAFERSLWLTSAAD